MNTPSIVGPKICRITFFSAALISLAAPIYAHERWVKHELKSEFDRDLFTSMGWLNVGTAIAVVALFVFLLHLSARVRASRPESSVSEKLSSLAPTILRATYGVGLLLMAWDNQFLAPDLVATDGAGWVLVRAQGVVGVMLALGLLTRMASWVSLALFAWAIVGRPFAPFDGQAVTMMQVLNYLDVAGIAVYLGIVGGGALSIDGWLLDKTDAAPSRAMRARAVGLMRIALGLTLVLLGLQKFVLPELPMGVVQNYADQIYWPIANITGVSPEQYVFAACVVETAVGLLVIAGVFIRPIMVVLVALFLTTVYIFQEDLLPHLPLFGMVAAFLIEGSGDLRMDSLIPSKQGSASQFPRGEIA